MTLCLINFKYMHKLYILENYLLQTTLLTSATTQNSGNMITGVPAVSPCLLPKTLRMTDEIYSVQQTKS